MIALVELVLVGIGTIILSRPLARLEQCYVCCISKLFTRIWSLLVSPLAASMDNPAECWVEEGPSRAVSMLTFVDAVEVYGTHGNTTAMQAAVTILLCR